MKSYVFTPTAADPDQLQQLTAMIQKYDLKFNPEENMIALSSHGYLTGQEAAQIIEKVQEALQEVKDPRAGQLDPQMPLTDDQRWRLIQQAVQSYTYMEDGNFLEGSGGNEEIVNMLTAQLTEPASH